MKNITLKCLSEDSVNNLDQKAAHAFSLLWMLICRKLPDNLSDNLLTWLVKTGIYWMNKEVVQGIRNQSHLGEIELDIGGNSFKFPWAELSPFSQRFH